MRNTRPGVAVSKGMKGKNVKTGSNNGRYLILAGLVIVLVIVVSWVTKGTLNNEIPAAPAEAVTDTMPVEEPAAPPPEPAPVREGIM